MQTVKLIVKGDKEQAREAAEARGFKVTSIRGATKNTDHVALVAEGSIDVAAHWFCEPSRCVEGYGYPAGTLLLYS